MANTHDHELRPSAHPYRITDNCHLVSCRAGESERGWLQTTLHISGLRLLCRLCRTSPPPAMGARFTVFWACRPCGPAGWLALLLTKADDVETNPDPTTLNKKVWICDICHKQIHVRKRISIRCNRIEHWVHRRCAGICQAQYTDTWTCHLHRESRLTPHTDITPPHRSRPWSKPPTHSPHTPPQPNHRHMSNTPPVPTGLVKPKPNSLIYSPTLHPHRPEPNTYTCHTLHQHLSQARHMYYTKHLNHVYHSYTHSPQPHLTRTAHQHCRHPRTLTLSQHTHMQHKQQYMHHSHRNKRTHNIGYYDNLTNRPRTITGLLTPHKHTAQQ